MKSHLKSVLFCALTLAGTRTLRAQEQPERRPTVRVRVYNYAYIDRATLTVATEYATQIFKDAGVDLIWLSAVAGAPPEPAPGETERAIIIVSHVSGLYARRDHTMGAADPEGLSALIFDDRINFFAHAFCLTTSFLYPAKRVVLGHAMAHELGHLFGLGHSEAGIMKPQLDCQDYRLAAKRKLGLVREQSRSILDQLQGRTN